MDSNCMLCGDKTQDHLMELCQQCHREGHIACFWQQLALGTLSPHCNHCPNAPHWSVLTPPQIRQLYTQRLNRASCLFLPKLVLQLASTGTVLVILFVLIALLAYLAKMVAWAIKGRPEYSLFPFAPVIGLAPSLGDLLMGTILLVVVGLITVSGIFVVRIVQGRRQHQRQDLLYMPSGEEDEEEMVTIIDSREAGAKLFDYISNLADANNYSEDSIEAAI